jgi:hypothetical protein
MSNTLYREWIIFLGALFAGLFILPFVLAIFFTDAINLANVYYTLFGNRQVNLSWGIVLLPYGLLWSSRLFHRITGFRVFLPIFTWQQTLAKA